MLEVTLIKADIDSLKQNSYIVTSLQTSWLSVAGGGVLDMAGQALEAVASSRALQASSFTSDLSRPSLDAFTLSLNTGALILQFSETIKASTVAPLEIVLQSKRTVAGDSSAASVALSGGTVQQTDNLLIYVQLTSSDQNALKAVPTLATSARDTFLTLTTLAAEDMSGNPIFAIADGATVQATEVYADTTQPTLADFSMDLNRGRLTLTFDETVHATSFVAGAVVLQSAGSSSQPGEGLQLQLAVAAALSAARSTEVVLDLVTAYLNEIKRTGGLCVSRETCFLSTAAAVVHDMSGNSAVLVPSTSALQARAYTTNTAPPVLQTFDLGDMDAGVLVMVFSETVRKRSVLASDLTLQSAAILVPGEAFTLTGDSAVLGQDGTSIRVHIGTGDLNELKFRTGMTTSLATTYLSFTRAMVRDMLGNQATAVPSSAAMQAVRFVPDATRPTLQRFYLDLNLGQLRFVFSEVMSTSTVTFGALTLQDAAVAPTAAFRLTGGGCCRAHPRSSSTQSI